MASNAKTALLCAYTLARARQYAEAEALILSHDELSKTPEAIDLLARIRMEEGDTAEARRLWQSIQTLYPEHTPSRNALKAMGKRPVRLPWRALLAGMIPVALVAGFLIGCHRSVAPEPSKTLEVTWDNIPTAAKIAALSEYKGRTKRVCISSHFFSRLDRLTSRDLLTSLVAAAVDVPETDVFLGKAPADAGETAIVVELELL